MVHATDDGTRVTLTPSTTQVEHANTVYRYDGSVTSSAVLSDIDYTMDPEWTVVSEDVFLQDPAQNKFLSTSRFGRAAPEEDWRHWYWMRDAQDPKAMINGYILGVGDKVGSGVITEIQKTSVTIKTGTAEKTYHLGQ